MNRFAHSLIVLSALAVAACGGDDEGSSSSEDGAGGAAGSSGAGGGSSCSDGEELLDGRCVDPLRRYEPEEQLDVDNVMVFSDMPQTLELPPPPKSGFRLVVPPRELGPGEEISSCHSWPIPKVKHQFVYAARIYTTPGLHHSNMLGVPKHSSGNSPYPECAPGQGDIGSHVQSALTGNPPEVVFANSTQIAGGESIIFPPGMGYRLNFEHEIATSIHWLNPSAESTTVETVYDFFTMPDEMLEEELVPFYFDNFSFEIPAQSTGDIVTECPLFGGNMVTMMVHTHERAFEVTTELLDGSGAATEVYRLGDFSNETDIHMFDEPLSLEGSQSVRYTCKVNNELTKTIDYGIGTDEMCTLFGYMYPPSAQVLGMERDGSGCIGAHIGAIRE